MNHRRFINTLAFAAAALPVLLMMLAGRGLGGSQNLNWEPVGLSGGLYRSLDGGQTWQRMGRQA